MPCAQSRGGILTRLPRQERTELGRRCAVRRVLVAFALAAMTLPVVAEWNNIRNLRVAVLDLQSGVGEDQQSV